MLKPAARLQPLLADDRQLGVNVQPMTTGLTTPNHQWGRCQVSLAGSTF